MDEGTHCKYRVIIVVLESDEWEYQELVDQEVFRSSDEAEARRGEIDLSRYPEGSHTFIEVQPWSPWRRLDV